jgi:ubiquitin-protein ligase
MPLPQDLLKSRVKNELEMCIRMLKHHITVSDRTYSKFPMEVNITLIKTAGPIMRDGKILHKFTHKLKIFITENYPYEKPIVRWQSEIFHPNVMMPDDGGYVCTKLLDDWSFSSNLMSFVKGLESLLIHPNPQNPYGSDSCTKAAEYFNKNPYKPPLILEGKKVPKIVQEGSNGT